MIRSRFASAGISLFCVGISFKDFHLFSVRFSLFESYSEYIFMFDRTGGMQDLSLLHYRFLFLFIFRIPELGV